MKEKVKKHIKKHEMIYSAIFILLCFSGFVFANNIVGISDEMFTFANIFKLSNGVQLYSQNNVIDTPLFFYLGELFLNIFGTNFLIYKINRYEYYNISVYSCVNNYFKILIVLNIVIKVVPTSAKTASHISAIPNMLRSNINIFTPIENIKFSFIILLVFLEISIASIIFFNSSVIITISDASIAEFDPIPPIDIPISALAKTGLSLIPSPTYATFFL